MLFRSARSNAFLSAAEGGFGRRSKAASRVANPIVDTSCPLQLWRNIVFLITTVKEGRKKGKKEAKEGRKTRKEGRKEGKKSRREVSKSRRGVKEGREEVKEVKVGKKEGSQGR